LARELGPDGVRCNNLLPGAIESPMTDVLAKMAGLDREDFVSQLLEPQVIKRFGRSSDTSAAVVWLLSSEAAHVTGMDFYVDAGETE
jgi:NAD(P)-dependent dehydrogenase (short-subunit alcohol dehydrogenase family)